MRFKRFDFHLYLYGQKSHPRLQKLMTGSDLRAFGCCCDHVADIGNWPRNPVPSIVTLHAICFNPILIWITPDIGEGGILQTAILRRT